MQLKAELQEERLRFAQGELAVAFTFLDVAKTTRKRETRERNIENARCSVTASQAATRLRLVAHGSINRVRGAVREDTDSP